MKSFTLILYVIFAAMLSSGLAYAIELQSLDSIRDSAKAFVGERFKGSKNVVISTNKIDSRLRMRRCSKPLQASAASRSQHSSQISVKISCQGNKPWSLYVPVSVKMMQDVVVLSNSLSAGSLISGDDIRLEKRDIYQMRSGYFSQPNEVVGKVIKRSIVAGISLNPQLLKTSQLIKRGQQVTLIAQSKGISVKMSGEAMSNGAAGERIKVKNLSSKRMIEGTINKEGVIIVAK